MSDPQEIERSIEAARRELTVTIEALAERLNPQRLKANAVASVKAQARGAFETAFYSPLGSPTLARNGLGQPISPGRKLRKDRVGAAAGVVILYVGIRVRARRHRKAAR